MFWIGGCLGGVGGVVAYEGWWHMDVQLYLFIYLTKFVRFLRFLQCLLVD